MLNLEPHKKYRLLPQMQLGLSDDIVVDNFAGGGGASTGIEQALGRPVDIAINHDPAAIAMHTLNHPYTTHYCESVWRVDPERAADGRRVSLAWFSPDCTHFAKARGKRPKSKKIRGLAWVTLRWINRLMPWDQHPALVVLENVEEFQTWGPLLPNGQPCPDRAGETFRRFVAELRDRGYDVDWRELRACDFGAPTIRKRLFMVARRDGLPIVWPEATHGAGLQPYRTVAECIDWSVPVRSIFGRPKPLADNTLRRIAKGVQRYVLDSARPFIVPIQHYGSGRPLVHSIDEPLRTITAYPKGGAFAMAVPFISKHYTGVVGHELHKPLGTITTADHHSLTQAMIVPDGHPMAGNADQVAAFLVKYYGTNIGLGADEPLHTITTRDRFGLVTVRGCNYRVADIGLRMLTPRELFNANGFPSDYIIAHNLEGKTMTVRDQVARCGNSVPPAFSKAIVAANMPHNAISFAA